MKQNEKHPHKAAVLATAIFKRQWVDSGEVSAVDFYNNLSVYNRNTVDAHLADIMQAADVPQPAKMPLLSDVEIIRDHNEWRKANSEDEAPMPYPHSAELVGRAMERVCELVPEYVRLAEYVIDLHLLSIQDFAYKYNLSSGHGNLAFVAYTAKELLEK